MIRIAAVGDIHFAEDSVGRLRPLWRKVRDDADLMLLAGDLTNLGSARQAVALAAELDVIDIPMVAVLGNHDHHSGEPEIVRAMLEDIGVRVLEDDHVTLSIRGHSVGIAGCKGFGGGFAGACGHAFGEPEMKNFMHLTERAAECIERNLKALRTDYRIALLHYSPVKDTLAGERLEIYPFLGSYRLAEALDHAGADLAVHGHAHHGTEKGVTARGIPVRNVAMPLIRRPYAVYCLEAHADGLRQENGVWESRLHLPERAKADAT